MFYQNRVSQLGDTFLGKRFPKRNNEVGHFESIWEYSVHRALCPLLAHLKRAHFPPRARRKRSPVGLSKKTNIPSKIGMTQTMYPKVGDAQVMQ